MLEPLRNPANWDNFRKTVVLVLIIWAAASLLFGIIYFFILGGRSPAPADIFRALILAAPCLQSGGRRRKTGANDFRSPDHGAAAEPNGFRRVVRARDAQRSRHRALAGSWPL